MSLKNVKQQLKLPDVVHIGVVVEDADRTADFLHSIFGIGPFRIVEAGSAGVLDRGEEKYLKVRLAFANMGQIEIELIQCLEGDSLQLDFLRKHGEGVHHLGFRVKDFQAKVEQAKAMGFDVLQMGPGGHFFAYLDTRSKCGGIIVELMEDRGGSGERGERDYESLDRERNAGVAVNVIK